MYTTKITTVPSMLSTLAKGCLQQTVIRTERMERPDWSVITASHKVGVKPNFKFSSNPRRGEGYLNKAAMHLFFSFKHLFSH